MKHARRRDEAIDYLRGISIMLIIVSHVMTPRTALMGMFYTSNSIIASIYESISFVVPVILILSGYSLYKSHSDLRFKVMDFISFYFHRARRLLLPWWCFCAVYFAVHYLLGALFGVSLISLSRDYMLHTFFIWKGGMVYGWLILLMLVFAFFFPFYKLISDKVGTARLLGFLLLMFAICHLYYFYSPATDIDPVVRIPFESQPRIMLSYAGLHLFGWSFLYVAGFSMVSFFRKRFQIMEEAKLAVFSFLMAVLGAGVLFNTGLPTTLIYSKFPPNFMFVGYGLFMFCSMMIFFFTYKREIHRHLKNFFMFFSVNSLWIYLWHILAIDIYRGAATAAGVWDRMWMFPVHLFAVFAITIALLFAQKKLIAYESTHIRI